MVKCYHCLKEISEEQHGKYFKRCPSCYAQYKAKQSRYFLAMGLLWIGISVMWSVFFFTFLQPSSFRSRSVLMAIMSLIVAQVSFFEAWLWKFTEVIHLRYNKRMLGLKVILIIPIILIFVIIIAAFFVEPFAI